MSNPRPQWLPEENEEPIYVGRIVAVPDGSVAGKSDPGSEHDRAGEARDSRQAAGLHPAGSDGRRIPADQPNEPLGRFGRNKTGILMTVFLAAGIMGLPLILYSPVFSKPEKVVWTIVVLAYTVVVFYLLYLIVVQAVNVLGVSL